MKLFAVLLAIALCLVWGYMMYHLNDSFITTDDAVFVGIIITLTWLALEKELLDF